MPLRSGAAPAELTDTSTGERQADDASPATSPAAPRSTPTPPEATAGSLPQKTPDQHTSAAGETTGAEAPLTRAATSKSRDPSTAPGAPPTRSAQGHREPPDRPRADTELLFPSLRGAYFDLHNFRTREWKPAQLAVGITPLRRVYDLRHTFATFALRAGISTFDLSRYMGASLTMIDRHYGHLARDGRDHAINLLDSYSRPDEADVHQVDVAWTLQQRAVATSANKRTL